MWWHGRCSHCKEVHSLKPRKTYYGLSREHPGEETEIKGPQYHKTEAVECHHPAPPKVPPAMIDVARCYADDHDGGNQSRQG